MYQIKNQMNNVEVNKQMKLSEHFSLGELTKTSVKTKDGNIPSHVAIENLKRVCEWLEHLHQNKNPSAEGLYFGSTWTATWVSGP